MSLCQFLGVYTQVLHNGNQACYKMKFPIFPITVVLIIMSVMQILVVAQLIMFHFVQLITTYYCEEPPQPLPTKSAATPTEIQPTSSRDIPSSHTPSTLPSQAGTHAGFSLNISSAVEMSLQLDSDADLINNVVMSSAAEEGEGLNQGAIVEPIMKDDLPIDLRVKLIISMINLGLTPSEVVTFLFSIQLLHFPFLFSIPIHFLTSVITYVGTYCYLVSLLL